MAQVEAIWINVSVEATSDGSEDPFEFGPDALTAGEHWIDVRSFVRGSLFIENDNNGNATLITIEAKRHADAVTEEAVTDSSVADGATSAVWDASSDLEKYAYIRVLHNGTNADVIRASLLCK